ncbi:MAG: hypothetical protein LBL87_01605 [Ruminococcus sp.]|jgi:hypothetical protein|nr:hypothetical protein [Ruminococcus sp.]
MNAEKYKNAIDGVRFSPDFEINLKRRLRGETLITMSRESDKKKTSLRAIALAGMSIAACFVCFIAVKTASERLDTGLVSEPAVTSIETEYSSFTDETGYAAAGDAQRFAAFPIPSESDEAAAEEITPFAVYDTALNGVYAAAPSKTDTGAGVWGGTYRAEVALEGLLSAFDSGTYTITYETAEKTVTSADTGVVSNGDVAESGEGLPDSVTVTTTVISEDYEPFPDGVRAYLEKVVAAGEKLRFSEFVTGTEECRIDINGKDETLLYSIWVFDNCVLVERFAPDGLMKCYVEIK